MCSHVEWNVSFAVISSTHAHISCKMASTASIRGCFLSCPRMLSKDVTGWKSLANQLSFCGMTMSQCRERNDSRDSIKSEYTRLRDCSSRAKGYQNVWSLSLGIFVSMNDWALYVRTKQIKGCSAVKKSDVYALEAAAASDLEQDWLVASLCVLLVWASWSKH